MIETPKNVADLLKTTLIKHNVELSDDKLNLFFDYQKDEIDSEKTYPSINAEIIGYIDNELKKVELCTRLSISNKLSQLTQPISNRIEFLSYNYENNELLKEIEEKISLIKNETSLTMSSHDNINSRIANNYFLKEEEKERVDSLLLELKSDVFKNIINSILNINILKPINDIQELSESFFEQNNEQSIKKINPQIEELKNTIFNILSTEDYKTGFHTKNSKDIIVNFKSSNTIQTIQQQIAA